MLGRRFMERASNIIKGFVIAIVAAGFALPARAADSSQASVREVYDEQFTRAIAKSLGQPTMLSGGDRFAIVQFQDGAWALAYVPRELAVSKKAVVELTAADTTPAANPGRIVVVKMLTKSVAV